MGTWGTGLYSDDLAADLRADFRDLIGEGLSADAALDRLKNEYASVLRDQDEEPVFWLALADTAWRLGRLPEQLRQNALAVIASGRDSSRWERSTEKAKRAQVLAKLRQQLLSPLPPPKRVQKPIRAATEWHVGEDKGGRSAVCELLDWVGQSPPTNHGIQAASIRPRKDRAGADSQFLFQEPRTKHDKTRVVRTGLRVTPAQSVGGYTAFVWPYVDRLLSELYGLE
jgi:hypothetical protein